MSIGDNIKKLRENKGWKQIELAQKIGVSDKTISSWEINRTEPKIGMIEKLCEVLKCKKTDIVGEDKVQLDLQLFGSSENEEHYYFNEDARELAEFMFKNPEYKVLFDASRKVKKEDIDFVRQMIDRVRGDDNDTGC